MSRLSRVLLASFLVLATAAHAAAGVTEGAIAPAGDCARAPELPPAGPARSSISSLFPPLDVAAGGGGTAVSGGIADAGQPGSGNPGRPESQGFSGPGACDVPGSGCAGGPAGARSIPPGGVLLPDGWIRFPDGSLLPPQGTSPTGIP
jgi:hypothetical protein